MTPEEAITALAHEQMRQIEKRRDFAKFLLSEMWREDREWRETLNASIEIITTLFVREIERGQADGHFRQDLNVHFTAQTIWATFLAGALNWTVVHPELDYHKLADDLASFALAGLYSQEEK